MSKLTVLSRLPYNCIRSGPLLAGSFKRSAFRQMGSASWDSSSGKHWTSVRTISILAASCQTVPLFQSVPVLPRSRSCGFRGVFPAQPQHWCRKQDTVLSDTAKIWAQLLVGTAPSTHYPSILPLKLLPLLRAGHVELAEEQV